MKVFLSWSGTRSGAAAEALRVWLPDVIQSVEPWMSRADIDAGTRWSRAIETQLTETRFGIICVTPDNSGAPWLNFEAGALAKTIEDTYVCPYLIGLTPAQLPQGPLALFQAKEANRGGTWDLVRALNVARKESALPESKLERTFDRWWPDLETALQTLPAGNIPAPARRSTDDMVAEVLDLVRNLSRREETRAFVDEAQGLIRVPLLQTHVTRNALAHAFDSLPPEKRASALEQLRAASVERKTQAPTDSAASTDNSGASNVSAASEISSKSTD